MRLKELREDRDLRQQDIADLLHISQVSYGRYELGLSEPSLSSLIKLADFYNVSLDYLVGRSSSKNEMVLVNKKYIDQLIEIVSKISKK